MRTLTLLSLVLFVAGCPGKTDGPGGDPNNPDPIDPDPVTQKDELRHPKEGHLADIKQLTRNTGENAEAYWSHDGTELIFQTKRPPYKCDQIMRVPADGSAEPSLVSTGKGRTTCAYFMPGNKRTVWSSTHETDPECPPEPDMSQGYVWSLYPSYEIYTSNADGSDLVKLTDRPGYDAEATVCPVDGSIIFTSTRDGDLELYRMDADGKNVKRLTHTPGYDGGAFFSRDCKQIVWRASRPEGRALADFKRLLKQNLVRPSRLEVFVADADGTNAKQVTYLNSASFAPYFHPSNQKILFSSNYPDPRGREFDIWSINVDGSGLERITYAPGFDGFPMFSPDGTKLAFASNRNQANDGETDVYVARWVESAKGEVESTAADRFAGHVAWLADDAREGRGVGTKGIASAAEWLEKKLAEAGAEGAFAGSFRQSLSVPTSIVRTRRNALSITRQQVGASDFTPASFSSNGTIAGKTMFVGYGISAPKLGHDDYKRGVKRRLKGKIAVIRRFVPPSKAFADDKAKRRYSDLYYKAFLARENGAIGVIFVDHPVVARAPSKRPPRMVKGAKPTKGAVGARLAPAKLPDDAPLPPLSLDRLKNVGIPAVVVKRSAGGKLTGRKSFAVSMTVDLLAKTASTENVVGVIRAGAKTKLPGVVVVGAHYDHLGFGGDTSLEPGVRAPHNGADDNASGTAGLIEVALSLGARKDQLARDVYIVAFTAEEMGLLGSSHFVKNLPPSVTSKEIVAMLNMDMIGRLRDNSVAALGAKTAAEWKDIIPAACKNARIDCVLTGDGYGPSDQTSFYAAGVPVLHFFTGAHGDYHKTTDDAPGVNAGGGARVAAVVADVAAAVAARDGRLTYQRIPAPLPMGDRRSWGASLGTIPDYADKGDVPGVLLTGVRPAGPAEKGGLRRGDRIIKIAATEIRTIHDLMFVLQGAKPGMRVPVVVLRDGKKATFKVTFGKSRRRGRK